MFIANKHVNTDSYKNICKRVNTIQTYLRSNRRRETSM